MADDILPISVKAQLLGFVAVIDQLFPSFDYDAVVASDTGREWVLYFMCRRPIDFYRNRDFKERMRRVLAVPGVLNVTLRCVELGKLSKMRGSGYLIFNRHPETPAHPESGARRSAPVEYEYHTVRAMTGFWGGSLRPEKLDAARNAMAAAGWEFVSEQRNISNQEADLTFRRVRGSSLRPPPLTKIWGTR